MYENLLYSITTKSTPEIMKTDKSFKRAIATHKLNDDKFRVDWQFKAQNKRN